MRKYVAMNVISFFSKRIVFYLNCKIIIKPHLTITCWITRHNRIEKISTQPTQYVCVNQTNKPTNQQKAEKNHQ
jgi:hypothetical protein